MRTPFTLILLIASLGCTATRERGSLLPYVNSAEAKRIIEVVRRDAPAGSISLIGDPGDFAPAWPINQSFVQRNVLYFRQGTLDYRGSKIHWNSQQTSTTSPEDIRNYTQIRSRLLAALQADPPPRSNQTTTAPPEGVCLVNGRAFKWYDYRWTGHTPLIFGSEFALDADSHDEFVRTLDDYVGYYDSPQGRADYLHYQAEWMFDLIGLNRSEYYLGLLEILQNQVLIREYLERNPPTESDE